MVSNNIIQNKFSIKIDLRINIFEEMIRIMKKYSIISGGSSGLGFSLSLKLLEAGRNVIILGRDKIKLENSVKKLKRLPAEKEIIHFQCNIGNEKDVRSFGEFIRTQNAGIDFLFNNAGRGLVNNVETSTSELIDKIMEANLKGMILLTSEVLKITPPSDELTIVNIMSTSALIGRAGETIYCAAKFGARGFTEALRAELKGTKRKIIAVYPGGIKTAFWNIADTNRDISVFMDPDEVASKIVNAVLNSGNLIVSDLTINRR